MEFPLLAPDVKAYLERLVPPRPPELAAMEDHAQQENFPIIGPVCGFLCYQVACMIGAKRIFELGSGFGYSTAWFARAVQENGGGEVHHVVWDEDLSRRAQGHLQTLGFADIVQYTVAEAVSTLAKTTGSFDIIFNDIDKPGYPASLPVIKQKLRRGGVLIVDNMLWSGRIFDPTDQSDSTEAIREFTRVIKADGDWLLSVIPIRDGLLIATKQV